MIGYGSALVTLLLADVVFPNPAFLTGAGFRAVMIFAGLGYAAAGMFYLMGRGE